MLRAEVEKPHLSRHTQGQQVVCDSKTVCTKWARGEGEAAKSGWGHTRVTTPALCTAASKEEKRAPACNLVERLRALPRSALTTCAGGRRPPTDKYRSHPRESGQFCSPISDWQRCSLYYRPLQRIFVHKRPSGLLSARDTEHCPVWDTEKGKKKKMSQQRSVTAETELRATVCSPHSEVRCVPRADVCQPSVLACRAALPAL